MCRLANAFLLVCDLGIRWIIWDFVMLLVCIFYTRSYSIPIKNEKMFMPIWLMPFPRFMETVQRYGYL